MNSNTPAASAAVSPVACDSLATASQLAAALAAVVEQIERGAYDYLGPDACPRVAHARALLCTWSAPEMDAQADAPRFTAGYALALSTLALRHCVRTMRDFRDGNFIGPHTFANTHDAAVRTLGLCDRTLKRVPHLHVVARRLMAAAVTLVAMSAAGRLDAHAAHQDELADVLEQLATAAGELREVLA